MTERGWTLARAGLLVAAAVLLSPVSPVPVVFVPLALLLLAFRSADWMSVAIAAIILALGFGGSRPGGMEWYVPRAWGLIAGGAFVAVTAVRGRERLLARCLMAAGLSLAVVLALGATHPALIRGVDWWMSSEIRHAAAVAGGLLGQLRDAADPEVGRRIEGAMHRWIGFQQDVYPAMVLLATLASLALAWFGLERLSGIVASPRPVKDFRFSDNLVWLLVGGLILLVLPLGGTAFRLGENATLFMGGLYLLRGTAILIWVVAASVTSGWTALLLGVAAVFLYPVVLGTALVLGLSDTWLDLRSRMARSRADGNT